MYSASHSFHVSRVSHSCQLTVHLILVRFTMHLILVMFGPVHHNLVRFTVHPILDSFTGHFIHVRCTVHLIIHVYCISGLPRLQRTSLLSGLQCTSFLPGIYCISRFSALQCISFCWAYNTSHSSQVCSASYFCHNVYSVHLILVRGTVHLIHVQVYSAFQFCLVCSASASCQVYITHYSWQVTAHLMLI
jgi:hypothetical protein